MTPWEKKDKSSHPERKSYGLVFFILSMLLAVTFLWAVYDDVVLRRSWKTYQEKFFSLEIDKLTEELKKENEALDVDSVTSIRENIAALREDFKRRKETSEYKEAVKKQNLLKTTFLDLSQKVRFAKAETEEAYYRYQHAFDAGKPYQSEKEEWETLTALLDSMKQSLETVQSERDKASEIVQSYVREVEEQEQLLKMRTSRIRNLEMKMKRVSEKTPEIKQIVIKNFATNNFGDPVLKVDRCISCHLAVDKKGFEDYAEPFKTHRNFDIFKKHPFAKFGCTSCHDGQGEGLSFYDAAHTPRNGEQARRWMETLEWEPISHWDKPMLEGDFIQSSCRKCHVLEEDIPGAPVLTKGINLFRETLGCVNCHPVKDYDDVNKIGPDLSSVGSKVTPAWLVTWINKAEFEHLQSRMPDSELSAEEAVSAAAYLMSLKGETSWKKHTLKSGVLGNTVLIKKGRELVISKGCIGCHKIGKLKTGRNKAREIAPDLSFLGNKTSPDWVLNWVINPKGYSPKTLMPDLRLTIEEGEAVVAYLMSSIDDDFNEITGLKERINSEAEIRKGLKIVSDYQCYGCHTIPGTENIGKIGPELTDFGNKKPYELAFGYATGIKKSWLGYTIAKMRMPRAFVTEKVSQKMPAYHLSMEETHALTVLLKSFRNEKIPKEFTKSVRSNYVEIQSGRKLIKKYNCIVCHEVEEGWGGENILSALQANGDENFEPSLLPPPLTGEGNKVQFKWLFDFISEPRTIRPWLILKMPAFNLTPKETDDIVKYFQARSGIEISYHFWRKTFSSETGKNEAKKLFELLKCIRCHSFGKDETVLAGELAPDLSLTKQRLKPDWVKDWLHNPQKIQPGTKMPNYFLIEEDGEVVELLPKPEKKIDLLVRFLFEM